MYAAVRGWRVSKNQRDRESAVLLPCLPRLRAFLDHSRHLITLWTLRTQQPVSTSMCQHIYCVRPRRRKATQPNLMSSLLTRRLQSAYSPAMSVHKFQFQFVYSQPIRIEAVREQDPI